MKLSIGLLIGTVFAFSSYPFLTAQESGIQLETPLAGPDAISAGDVSKIMSNQDWVLVDARSPDAFNGWALDGAKRGGHIPNAVGFSASWLSIESDSKTEQLTAALKTKGIDRDKHVVVYSIRLEDRMAVTDFLTKLGYTKLYHLDFTEWIESGRALNRYPAFHRLVPPSIVKRLIEGARPETFEDSARIKLVEVSWGDETASYTKGHIPGSFHVNTDHFEPPPTWKLGSPDVLNRFAKDYGFQADDTVVISGEDVTASYRLAVVLQYMGVADVRVLNGGFAAWKRAGYAIETKRNPPPIAERFGVAIPQRAELIVSTDQVKAGLRDPAEFFLVDNRTWAEFSGETTGYTYHQHKGRIPGSIYGQAEFKGPNSLTPYRNIDDTMRNADEILALWRRSGINPDKKVCFMCGGGWRAAEVLTFAQVIGVPHASLYSDGWIGWSNDRSNPVETGPSTGQ